MIITDLPQEILDEIVENFVRHTGRIANLSLTCRAFLPRCQRHLFSTIKLLANGPARGDRVMEFASIIQRPSCPIGTYVRQLHMYFGGFKQTETNMNIVFPSILPLLSNVQMLTVGLIDGIMMADVVHRLQVQRTWSITLSNEAFTHFLGSPSLTTLVISKFGFPGLLSKCIHVRSLKVRSMPEFELGTSTPDHRPRISSLSCGASLPTVRYLIPGFPSKSQGNEKDIVDLSVLRRLTLIPEFDYAEDMTQSLINYLADTLEDLDCGALVFQSLKFEPMPHLRTLKRWIYLLPSKQILSQLCDVLTHCTTTSKEILHITINLAVVHLSFEEVIRLDWSYVDDIFENPPPTLRKFTLGMMYSGTFEGKPVLLGDLQTALKSVMEQRMPRLTTMASSKPHVFKFSFIALG